VGDFAFPSTKQDSYKFEFVAPKRPKPKTVEIPLGSTSKVGLYLNKLAVQALGEKFTHVAIGYDAANKAIGVMTVDETDQQAVKFGIAKLGHGKCSLRHVAAAFPDLPIVKNKPAFWDGRQKMLIINLK
jgi:hypothetical protein